MRSGLAALVPSGAHLSYDIIGLPIGCSRVVKKLAPMTLLDHHGRFPSTASHALRNGYLERPIVDEWLEILRQVLERLWPCLPFVRTNFQVLVSHDVDAPSAYAFGSKRSLIRAMAGDVLKRRDLSRAVSAPWIRLKSSHRLHPDDPFNTFEKLMDISEAVGIHSAFYFIAVVPTPVLMHVMSQSIPQFAT